ncbi:MULTISPECIES: hypothetical protein [unclassified Synechococcus]|uniref:hypothetical protein n=1 Tax=unclassified Synechococcus TaxID=2626047 RepID=UPI0008FF503B|nr:MULTISPECIES: hypothetical protein [unclassified Synechococcus]APD47052.1 hypothetical protein BM449_00355 [Synechococcus sp. SynAce01]TWB89043.1 hypothetical protein FB106_11451 [Synechococcus sp. Ace-Pa]
MAAAAPGQSPDQPFLPRPLRRYGRRTAARRVTTSLWPDVYAHLSSYASLCGLTPSGAIHDILRRYFNLSTDL